MATLKQKATLRNIPNSSDMGQAMRKAGYSTTTSKKPKVLTESKGWKKLLEEEIPDKLLTQVHKEGLEATFTDEFNTDEPDFAVRFRYMESGYKIKGKLKDLDTLPQTNNQTLIIINPPSNGTPKD